MAHSSLVLACLVASVSLAACQTELQGPNVQNPTGNCIAPDDGGRAGAHSPGATTWLPDCQNTLRREYWRVFAQSAERAYVIPRPDGAPELGDACQEPNDALHDIVQAYALCHPAQSAEQVELVNNMLPADALKLTHFLHTKLKFEATGTSIAPGSFPTDILDACALHPNSAELEEICDRERDRLQSGQGIGFTYEGVGAEQLAARLNELYGIP